MFQNDNGAIVKKMTGRTIAANKSRNLFVIVAIALTALLITSVFSIGMSYLESSELQQIRLIGTTAHASVTNITDAQIEKLQSLDYVKAVGLGHYVAKVENTPEMRNMVINLYWYDKTEWEQFRAPAGTDIVGSYPEKYNEIMIPRWVLQNMGIENPKIGMKIPLDFVIDTKNNRTLQNETFVLSGYFTDYVHIRSGNIDVMLVSEGFAQQSGTSVEKNGSAFVAYRGDKNIERYNERLSQDLSLAENQKIKTVPMYKTSSAVASSTTFAFAAIIFFLMFTGYLLIYNVLYISVSKDIRFYGLLKTIGTTPKQLKKIVVGQAVRLSAVGIPAGLIVGVILSFAVVPMALGISDMDTGVEISFSPVIFIGAAFFALITTLIGAVKPARMAAKITPVEAICFTGTRTSGKLKRSTSGGKPHKMAWRNIFRDRKRAAVVLLSLFLGITTFMVITSLVSSMDTDNYIASYVENDFILKNNTLDAVGINKDKKQKFDTAFMKELEDIKGITNLRTTFLEKMTMKYHPEQFAPHVEWFRKRLHIIEELTEKNIQDGFFGYIIGLDSRYIEEFNKGRETPIDIAAFERGEFALIGTDNPEIYANVDVMDITITSTNGNLQIPLGGFIPFGFQHAGGGMAPNIYMSKAALEKLMPDPLVYKVNMDVEDNLEEQALEKIKVLTDNDYEITRTSKLEQQEMMSDTKLMMYILGGGIAIVLAFIGILNFVNVMSTGIMVRRHEFAMLESIGMTKKQIRRMLILEGVGYAGITMLLAAVLGSAITFGIFKLFQQQADYAIFSYPFVQMLLAIAAVLLVCIVTPEMAYRSSNRVSIVERLRETE